MPVNLTQADLQQRKRDLDAVARLQWEADVKAVMGTPHGQRAFARVIWTELRRPSINVNATHPEFLLAMIAGRKTVVEELEAELQRISPLEYRQMSDERIKAENTEAATLRALVVPKPGER